MYPNSTQYCFNSNFNLWRILMLVKTLVKEKNGWHWNSSIIRVGIAIGFGKVSFHNFLYFVVLYRLVLRMVVDRVRRGGMGIYWSMIGRGSISSRSISSRGISPRSISPRSVGPRSISWSRSRGRSWGGSWGYICCCRSRSCGRCCCCGSSWGIGGWRCRVRRH